MKPLLAFHGTSKSAKPTGNKDPVSNTILDVFWASNSYYLAHQFQDGEIQSLTINLENPIVITEDIRNTMFPDLSHASIVRKLSETAQDLCVDAVIFLDTIDGMESGDVIAIFENSLTNTTLSNKSYRQYDDDSDEWVSDKNFPNNIDTLPTHTTWELTPTPNILTHILTTLNEQETE